MPINYMKAARIGAVVGVLSALVGKVYNIFSSAGQVQASLDLAPIGSGIKSQLQSGVATDLSSKIIGWLNGVLPITVEGAITMAIAGALTFVIGAWIVNLINKPIVMKAPMNRLVSMAVLGSLASGIILSLISGQGVQLPTLGTAISLVGYFLIVTIIYQGLARRDMLKKILVEA